MAVLCSDCGFDNPERMNFCGKCGTPLQAEPTPASQQPIQEFSGVMAGPDLLERFRKAGLEAAGERRKVVVLFADLTDYTSLSERIDGEDLYEIIQKYIRLLMECVYRYEGMIDKILGDGILALFGAPIAHENDAERAIRSAMDMQSALKRFNWELGTRIGSRLKMHIGLNSGSVIAGGIGLNDHLDYTVIGDTVNLAQRVGSVAESDTILVSEKVYHQTRKLFDYEEQPPQSLKGVSAPVITYQLGGAKTRPEALRGIEGMHAPLIGRQAEFEHLRRVVDTVTQEQHGELVLLEGEAGIGKSRLVLELKENLVKAPWRILEGRSLTYRRSIPYWIFIELMREYFGIHGEQTDAEIRTRLAQGTSLTLGERSKDVLPYLEHLFSLSPSKEDYAERLRYLEGEQLRQQIFLAVKELWVAEAKRQPLLLILEDLHWADEASIKLFVFLLNSLKRFPLLLCGVSRSFSEDGLSEIISQASQRLPGHFKQMKVKALSKTQSAELFSGLVGNSDLPEAFEDQIIQRSSGNPLFLEEILRMLIDSKQIVRDNGTWELGKEGEAIGLPATLEALALTRLDRLLPEQRRIVQIASVIGREFDVRVLAEVVDVVSEKKLETVLSVLVQRGFIEPTPKTGKRSYSFRHVITSDAIYGTLLRRERKELHAAVGAAIETVYADRIDEYIELLAHHYSWSANLERALHYLILAGQKASRAYVNTQAREHYEQALAILPRVEHDHLQKIQIYVGLADVLLFVGEYEDSRKYYYEALEVIEHAPERDEFLETKVAACRKIGTTFERQGDFQNALSHLEEAQQAFSTVDTGQIISEWARIKNDIGWIHFRQGGEEQAEEYLREALEIVEGTSHYQVVASIFNRLGGVYFQKGELAQATNYVRKGLVLQEEIGDLAAVARSYNNLGLLEWRQENWDNALKNYEQSMELNATLGDIEAIIHLQGNIGILYIDKGDLEQAEHHLEQCLSNACDIGHSYLEGAARLQLSRYWLAARDWEKAINYCDRSLVIYNEIGAQESFVDLYWCKGEAYLGLGEIDKVEKSSQTALEIIDKAPAGRYALEEARVVRLQGQVAFRRGDLNAARELLNKSMEKFVSLGNKLEIGRATVILAKLIREQGDIVGARVQANEARLIFRSLGAQLDLKELKEAGF